MRHTMIAKRAMTYAGKRLQAGDEFSAPRRDARVLAAIGRASRAGKGLTALRREYQEAVGKRPYHGWDADTLREKIAQAGEYSRRDMRAED